MSSHHGASITETLSHGKIQKPERDVPLRSDLETSASWAFVVFVFRVSVPLW